MRVARCNDVLPRILSGHLHRDVHVEILEGLECLGDQNLAVSDEKRRLVKGLLGLLDAHSREDGLARPCRHDDQGGFDTFAKFLERPVSSLDLVGTIVRRFDRSHRDSIMDAS